MFSHEWTHTSNVFFIAESDYKALQTSELPLLHVLQKSEILTKKIVSNVLLKSKDESGIEKLNMYFAKADTLIIFTMSELD